MASVMYDHVWKKYGDVVAVQDLNLAIEDKEFLVLVGPSGCGKTTALRCLAGLEEITQGEVKIGDQVVNDVAPKDRDIAMGFQSYALYPHMSVYDNMAFGLKRGPTGFAFISVPAALEACCEFSTHGRKLTAADFEVEGTMDRTHATIVARTNPNLKRVLATIRTDVESSGTFTPTLFFSNADWAITYYRLFRFLPRRRSFWTRLRRACTRAF